MRFGAPLATIVIFCGSADDHRLLRAQSEDTDANLLIPIGGIRRNLEADIVSRGSAV
jgi:hypothetical protein